MGMLIQWLKGSAAPNDYVEVSETNPFPVMATNIAEANSTLSSDSVVGKVSVTTTATPLRVGVADLVGRTEIVIANDSSFLLFIGFNASVSGTAGMILNSGSTISFALDPANPFTLYGKAIEMPANITVIEIK